jgi:hypothetical protein
MQCYEEIGGTQGRWSKDRLDSLALNLDDCISCDMGGQEEKQTGLIRENKFSI